MYIAKRLLGYPPFSNDANMNKKRDQAIASQELIQDAVPLVLSYPKVPLTVDCVIFGFEENKLKVLLIKSDLKIFQNK